tara:strand:- start:113 stop:853 length:741 start_codon:yes stop_codon:yes gene_type:complete
MELIIILIILALLYILSMNKKNFLRYNLIQNIKNQIENFYSKKTFTLDCIVDNINKDRNYIQIKEPISILVYRPGSRSEFLRQKAVHLLKPLLSYIKITTKKIYFITDFNKIIEYTDNIGNKKILIDFNIASVYLNHFTTRVYIEIILLKNDKSNINFIKIYKNDNLEDSEINTGRDIKGFTTNELLNYKLIKEIQETKNIDNYPNDKSINKFIENRIGIDNLPTNIGNKQFYSGVTKIESYQDLL